ncbi:MAG: DUF3108 domain-containing protein [Bryobacteraceae bacterium]|nr:DUF3108 domain-containing protein [Bryobacteraceae bacterium]
MKFVAALLLGLAAASAGAADTKINFHEETLRYNVNWPSGLSLGEVQLRAQRLKDVDRWKFEFELDAAVPGFKVIDRFRSLADNGFCTAEFDKDSQRGAKSTKEKTTVDAGGGVAKRETLNGGGATNIPVPACVHDALAFLYFVRTELAQGRIAPGQTILFGAPYNVRLEYKGTQQVTIAGTSEEADRIVTSLKGPASQLTFDIYFGKDPSRTPVLVRVPLAMGLFSMEIAR